MFPTNKTFSLLFNKYIKGWFAKKYNSFDEKGTILITAIKKYKIKIRMHENKTTNWN